VPMTSEDGHYIAKVAHKKPRENNLKNGTARVVIRKESGLGATKREKTIGL